MKFFRYRAGGEARLGFFDGNAHRDLRAALERKHLATDEKILLASGFFTRDRLEEFFLSAGTLPVIDGEIDFDVPIAQPAKILAIGKNFAAHAAEFGAQAPQEPMFFAKLENSLLAHGRPIPIPYWLTSRVDHEAELAVVVGKEGKNVPASRAMEFVAGYTVFNDVTARKMQGDDRKEGHPWLRSKSLDGSAPCGPYWVPAFAIPEIAQSSVACRVNGELRQNAKIAELVHPIPKLVEFLSRFVTLRPGDLISTGTPSGVGPIQPGDEVECEITGVGVLRNPVSREKLHGRDLDPSQKSALLAELAPRIESALQKVKDPAARNRRAVDLLHASLPHFHWTGIYLLEGETLVLGPYHGKPTEHARIPVGKGICGQAVAEQRSIVVDDVTKASNYLACSIETRSEIVVPIRAKGKIVGEIDVDSDRPGAFDESDRAFLERVAALLSS